MTPGTRRIPAVPGGQGPRADLIEARGSDPRRILRRQRTLSACPSPAFPIPWKVFPWKVFPWKIFDSFLAGQTGAPGPPKLRNQERL
jgi:hypothetical protein